MQRFVAMISVLVLVATLLSVAPGGARVHSRTRP